jgi:RNA polymerase sigma-70 factor, ECF subfamily
MTNPLEEVLRIEGARVLATLIRFTGDITIAEDAVQDAVIIALQRWPSAGVPQNPGAWLTTAARHRALDRIRRESTRFDREKSSLLDDLGAHADAVVLDDATVRDNQLRLIFTCCHPALAAEQRIALALRTIGGLKTPEIARTFLVSDSTMGQRISRAKAKIASANIPYRVPEPHELPDRLPSVLQVVSSIFTAGHHAAAGSLHSRIDLCDEGIRLAEMLVELMPDEAECAGLLALLLATHARRNARLDDVGAVVLMADQDRALWDHNAIARAGEIVEWTLKRGRPGPFQIQAAIACLHGHAATFAETDWPQIAELYEMLENRQPTAVVRVNRAVAESFAHTPARGLALLEALLESEVAHWHLYWTTRAELLVRSSRPVEAKQAWQRALACEINDTDRSFIESRIASLQGLG